MAKQLSKPKVESKTIKSVAVQRIRIYAQKLDENDKPLEDFLVHINAADLPEALLDQLESVVQADVEKEEEPEEKVKEE